MQLTIDRSCIHRFRFPPISHKNRSAKRTMPAGAARQLSIFRGFWKELSVWLCITTAYLVINCSYILILQDTSWSVTLVTWVVIPVGDFSLSKARVMSISSFFTLHYRATNSPSLFTYHTHDDSDSADPSSMQETCHIRTQLIDLALHGGSGDHGFDSCQGLKFSVPH